MWSKAVQDIRRVHKTRTKCCQRSNADLREESRIGCKTIVDFDGIQNFMFKPKIVRFGSRDKMMTADYFYLVSVGGHITIIDELPSIILPFACLHYPYIKDEPLPTPSLEINIQQSNGAYMRQF